MTDDPLTPALPAAFPAEPAGGALHARVVALAARRHKTLQRRIWPRRITLAAATLWIAHNLPATLRVWRGYVAENRPGRTIYIRQTTARTELDRARQPQSETWIKRTWQRTEYQAHPGSTIFQNTIFRDGKSYSWTPSNPKRVSIQPLAQSHSASVPIAFSLLQTLLFRVGEPPNTGIVEYRGRRVFSRVTTYPEPSAIDYILQFQDQYDGRLLYLKTVARDRSSATRNPVLYVEYFYDQPIPDSRFALDFPPGTVFTYQPAAPVVPPRNLIADWWQRVLLGAPVTQR